MNKPYLKKVPTISLKEIIDLYPSIDLLELDIQGAELDVLQSSIDHLNKVVKKIVIGTHSPITGPAAGRDLEKGLRVLFQENGWISQLDYSYQDKIYIDNYAVRHFDGLQVYINPYFIKNI